MNVNVNVNVKVTFAGPLEVNLDAKSGGPVIDQVLKQIQSGLFKLEKTVALLDDKIDAATAAMTKAQASLDAAVVRTQTEVATHKALEDSLNAQIVALQAEIDQGGATPERIAKMDALTALGESFATNLDALDPSTETVIPTP